MERSAAAIDTRQKEPPPPRALAEGEISREGMWEGEAMGGVNMHRLERKIVLKEKKPCSCRRRDKSRRDVGKGGDGRGRGGGGS
ncbi:hypothetical protein NECAME_16004 [Necator americanus]|uniref:Uncharacterized protein n=1 Tax=Necator americanus TaxID=51031 RepID=W2U0Z5_NECAM|nr:hypothetical protein NECAME_16004 [Necator americanus]ETN86987.1 hypothetical protein NECAME_16004 [Necator americanus]